LLQLVIRRRIWTKSAVSWSKHSQHEDIPLCLGSRTYQKAWARPDKNNFWLFHVN